MSVNSSYFSRFHETGVGFLVALWRHLSSLCLFLICDGFLPCYSARRKQSEKGPTKTDQLRSSKCQRREEDVKYTAEYKGPFLLDSCYFFLAFDRFCTGFKYFSLLSALTGLCLLTVQQSVAKTISILLDSLILLVASLNFCQCQAFLPSKCTQCSYTCFLYVGLERKSD